MTAPVRLEFASILANSIHDMKNSLSLLINNIEQIAGHCGAADCPSKQTLSKLGFEAKRVNNQLVQLLSLYKLDQNQFYLNVVENEVSEWLHELVLQHAELFDARGLTLNWNCPKPLLWFFDPTLVNGVINNIVTNAFRYAHKKVTIGACKKDQTLVLSVNDDGEGYPESLCALADKPISGINFQTGSTGLGLYFAYQVANMHTHHGRVGSIRVSNGGPLGGGLFELVLP